jgi:cytidylate kinase
MPLPDCIAIDGPAGSGKSTIGEKVARKLGYLFFDTGVMYRAVTWAALEQFKSVEDEEKVSALAEKVHIDVKPPSQKDGRKCDVYLDGVDITWKVRTPEVDRYVSPVSAYRGVRIALTEQQRRIAQRGRTVMAGRDIGTVVLPEADLKIYLDASVEERARRRYAEVMERGEQANFAEILASIQRRDEIDSTRALAPLKPAADAHIINTEGLTIDQVLKRIIRLVKSLQ